MMTNNQSNECEQLEMLKTDQLVPEDHLVRKLESTIDFSFIYPLVEYLYSGIGRPSIDPLKSALSLPSQSKNGKRQRERASRCLLSTI